MPSGFQVYTNNGSVLQVDSDSISYSLRKSGVVSTNYEVEAGFVYVGHIDITGFNSPCVAIATSNSCVVEVIKPKGALLNSQGEYVYESGRQYVRFTSKVKNLNVQYYVFDTWLAPSGRSGIEIFDSSGNTTFHSDWHLMSVVDFITIPAGEPAYYNTFNAGNVAGDVAISKTLNRVFTLSQQRGPPSTLKDEVHIENGNIIVSYLPCGPYGNSDGWNYLQNYDNNIIVLDVSKIPKNYG